MNYPDNYDNPVFPAGPRIASTRVVGICLAVVVVLIWFVCIALGWAVRSQRVSPVIIATGGASSDWVVVQEGGMRRTIKADQALQESLIARYVRGRFSISLNAVDNDILWSECDRARDCYITGNTVGGRCALFCAGTTSVFAQFMSEVVPDYRLRATRGEHWSVSTDNMRIVPTGNVNENGGMWRVDFSVNSNMSAPFRVVAYVDVGRNKAEYPATLGFYIAGFNAYRLD